MASETLIRPFYADLRVRDLYLCEIADRALKAEDDRAEFVRALVGAAHPAQAEAWQS